MSIGKVGPRGPLATSAGSPATTTPARAREGFQVERPVAAAQPMNMSGPLAGLRSGALGPSGYVQAHVEQATSHLLGLGAETTTLVRETLRDLCESSPLLSELVALAGGGQR